MGKENEKEMIVCSVFLPFCIFAELFSKVCLQQIFVVPKMNCNDKQKILLMNIWMINSAYFLDSSL
ncbi:hypothetical protein H5410_057229 [Solanum commersonii]|uniref:Uncharacterized protein n=1 Tax=Solanum commersonii TaxID=4109 RepID=A0A9J5WPH2_SOLCO|nr:hypothetical protein H5410_057229 [Solanum commersonii]